MAQGASGQLSSNAPVVHIRSSEGIRAIDLRELWEYRELLYFLIWRDVKVRYAQSALGISWAVIQPLLYMIVLSLVFGTVAKVSSDGAPYPIFIYAALVPWTFFSTALIESTTSLIQNSNMLTKVYFPRLIMPLAPVLGRLVDFSIAMLLLVGLMLWFRTAPTIWASALPLLIFTMVMTAAGIGMWLTALAVQYRDVKYGINFIVQLMMYAAPVVYPASVIPDQYRLFYAINPLVGVIEGFRSALLGTNSMPWDLIVVGNVASIVIAVSGVFWFRRMERIFADVV